MAVKIAQPAAEQQESSEGQQVGVDDPDERSLGKPEVRADRREGDIDDRGVENDHQNAEA